MIVYDCPDVLHAGVTHFILKVWLFGKWASIGCRKDWAILFVTLLLYGELNNVMFRWRFLFLFS